MAQFFLVLYIYIDLQIHGLRVELFAQIFLLVYMLCKTRLRFYWVKLLAQIYLYSTVWLFRETRTSVYTGFLIVFVVEPATSKRGAACELIGANQFNLFL